MAPEQLQGKDTGPGTDVFAFGTVLYEMITGRRAFEGDNQASLVQTRNRVE
jgi:eukaryotic-like serine/threonine-protein kinase